MGAREMALRKGDFAHEMGRGRVGRAKQRRFVFFAGSLYLCLSDDVVAVADEKMSVVVDNGARIGHVQRGVTDCTYEKDYRGAHRRPEKKCGISCVRSSRGGLPSGCTEMGCPHMVAAV